MDEIRDLFFTECGELMADMEARLLTLDGQNASTEQLNAIFRSAHSIKGGSGAFGMSAIAAFTHAMEALLDALREQRASATREVVDSLLVATDMLGKMVAAEQQGTPLAGDFCAEMVAKLQRFIGQEPSHAPIVAPAEAAPPPATENAAAVKSGAQQQVSSIRVDLEKVDRLVNMVGELVITEAMLRAQVRHLPQEGFAGLLRGIDELSHHTRELQEAVMAVRMQPVKSVFSRMPRIVRDAAAQLGKDIQLVMSGENTEVDKTVIESLSDPLTHMIRNSVDHGIETPDQRVWNDKPAQGTIHLSAYHRSGRILIELSDDGAGINRQRVLEKAKAKGLVAEDALLGDEEIDQLIFLPGFSTAETVTNLSGRGVGMDVVRRNIEGLGGHVRLHNTPGKGTNFTVSLPLTLAILDGMIVRVGGEHYIIPITSIIETLRPRAEEMHAVEGRSDVINVRGEFVPLLYLHRVFGVRGAVERADQGLVVLVEHGNGKAGLVVDELIGQQQVVIKSIEANTNPIAGISGATILGDGKVSLILEINDVCSLVERDPTPLPQAA